MNITIIGCGYVGLVSGTCLSDVGHNVVCLDINKNKIASLKKGVMPIYEDGLEKMVRFNTKKKRLGAFIDEGLSKFCIGTQIFALEISAGDFLKVKWEGAGRIDVQLSNNTGAVAGLFQETG